ncbi:hypothetical protein M2651_05645 [Clostridium sp. SYSU_GA19001]|uniref:hypothetical protein n=1 Tax=Clostridium caldaquaticum TaxID=2940653 RepID=UPI0020771031|nr:hypothetical protein [Clostridium caldaquaticum]MCM8710508.1 hypothetical protein [Clostridium caldaquaticum]
MPDVRVRYITMKEAKQELVKQLEAEKRYLKVIDEEVQKRTYAECINKINILEEQLRRLYNEQI